MAQTMVLGPEAYETLVDEGATLLDEGKLVEGAQRLGTAWQQMPPKVQTDDLGTFVVVRASDAYHAAAEAEEVPEQLRAHKELLDAFFAQAGSKVGKDEQRAMLAERRDALAVRLEEIDAAAAAERKAEDEQARKDAEEEQRRAAAAEPTDDTPKAKPDGLAIGLLAGGGALLAGGVVLAVQGGRFPGLIDQAKQDGLASYGLDEEPDNWADHEQQQFGVGRALLASGITLAVVGAGAMVLGGVRLAQGRKAAKKTARAMPVPLRRGAGVAVTMGF